MTHLTPEAKQESDTPITDARWQEEWQLHAANPHSSPAHGMCDLATELERQLATVTAERDALQESNRQQSAAMAREAERGLSRMSERNPIMLARIAETLCVCDMTDGFCMPSHKPTCRCWGVARAVYRTMLDAPNPVVSAGWNVTDAAYSNKDKANPRAVLEAMLRATPSAAQS